MVHNDGRHLWEKRVWQFPLIHNFEFGFGLGAENTNKANTIQPYFFQDNALIDYELIKTNPENADFAVDASPNVRAGSYIPKVHVSWEMFIPPSDLEIVHLKCDTMVINTSMLNRLDAFDKKTGEDIESLIGLTHETTDEQTLVDWNGTDLFEESTDAYDLPAGVAGLTATQQPEGVAFDKEKFFDAMHYYTNKEMLKLVTQKLKTHLLSEPIIPHGRSLTRMSRTFNVAPLCKFQHPYTFCGELFSVPQAGARTQYHMAANTTDKEHLRVRGYVRFYEFNPDFNMARA